MQPLDLTFFVPCYNEAENIENTIQTIIEAVRDRSLAYEILVFDDSSTDDTVERVKKIGRKHSSCPIRLLCGGGHRGLGFNYFRGSFFARGKGYMLINGDNVEPAETIRKIIAENGKYEMIVPYFGANDKRSPFRRRVSWVFTAWVNFLGGYKLQYYNGPVLHLTENVRFWRSETVGYGYQAELLCRLLNEGKTYTEVQVVNADRERGFSKAFALKNILSVSNSLFHIFWRRMEYGVFQLMKPGVSSDQGLESWVHEERMNGISS